MRDLRTLGVNVCASVRICPASQYLVCGCPETGLNCWDVVGKPCCKRDLFERCLTCEIYLGALETAEAKAASG